MEKGKVHAKYQCQMDFEDIVRAGKILMPGIGEVEVLPLNDCWKLVTIRRFPIWMENDVVKKVLEKFGKVIRIEFKS